MPSCSLFVDEPIWILIFTDEKDVVLYLQVLLEPDDRVFPAHAVVLVSARCFEGKKRGVEPFLAFQEWEACPFPGIPYRQSAMPIWVAGRTARRSCDVTMLTVGVSPVKGRLCRQSEAGFYLRLMHSATAQRFFTRLASSISLFASRNSSMYCWMSPKYFFCNSVPDFVM